MRKVYLKAYLNLCRYLCLNLLNVNSKYFIHCAFLFLTWRGGNFTSRGTFPVSGTLQRVQLWSRWLHHLVCTFYRQARQGNIFRSVCHSVQSGEGGRPPSGGRPSKQRPSLWREAPRTETPLWTQTPTPKTDPLKETCARQEVTSYTPDTDI